MLFKFGAAFVTSNCNVSHSFDSSATTRVTERRPTWAEIDLNALAANFHIVKDHVGEDVNVMAVVKANAYGHGAVECARRLEVKARTGLESRFRKKQLSYETTGLANRFSGWQVSGKDKRRRAFNTN